MHKVFNLTVLLCILNHLFTLTPYTQSTDEYASSRSMMTTIRGNFIKRIDFDWTQVYGMMRFQHNNIQKRIYVIDDMLNVGNNAMIFYIATATVFIRRNSDFGDWVFFGNGNQSPIIINSQKQWLTKVTHKMRELFVQSLSTEVQIALRNVNNIITAAFRCWQNNDGQVLLLKRPVVALWAKAASVQNQTVCICNTSL